MSTTEPIPPVASTEATETTESAVPGVGEMPSPREIAAIISMLVWSGITWFFGGSDAITLWGLFFGLGLSLDIIDIAFRYHYRKVWANQLLWWFQPHYVVAAILGLLIDWVFPINLTLSFVVTIVLGVIISIPIERYYVSLEDSE